MDIKNILIRDYTTNDFKGLEICLRKLQDYEQSIDDDKVDGNLIDREYVNLMHKSCLKDNSRIFVAESNNKIVGFIHFELNKEICLKSKYVYISDFVVLEKYRKQGIGSLLIGECIKFAKNHGFGNVQLEVLAKNSESVNYYQNCGFETYALIMKKPL